MGVHESNMKIKEANKDMGVLWEQTRVLWKDAKAKQFENEFVKRLAIEVNRTRNTLGNMGILLDRIRADLRDRS